MVSDRDVEPLAHPPPRPAVSLERHQREAELFDRTCDLAPREQTAFLARTCADEPELRARVERLLALDRTPATALDRQALAHVASALAPPETPARLGPYRILGELGRGGMGVVYRAEQESPRREVALKVIRTGWLDSGLLARFQHEARVLGWLHHPGIAHIYEAAVAETPRGPQPYLAMELVRGEPLTRWCERHALDVNARLALLARVCDAVDHAHQKGVIHRDLKPGNVLVDEGGQPKVLDFGVARVTDHDLRASTVATRAGELVGTHAYKSPEQLSGRPDAVDTRADVYALGVIAFELLTGCLPYDLGELALPEATRVVRDEEPRRVSAVRRELRGDVSTIVAKALEKEPARRYGSARELASDLRRVLADEPIVARPASRIYHMAKFVRRNRGLSAGLALAVLSLVTGTVVSLLQVQRANEAREEALRAARRALLAAATAAAEVGDYKASRSRLDAVAPAARAFEWRHLDARLDASLARIVSDVPLQAASFVEDGSALLIANATGEVQRWSPDGLERLGSAQIEDELAGPAAFSRDGTRLAGAFLAGDVRRVGWWELASGRRLAAVDAGELTRALSVDPAGARVAFGATGTFLWEPASGAAPRALLAHLVNAVNSFAFSADGGRVACSYQMSVGGLVRACDLVGEVLAREPTLVCETVVPVVALAADGARIAAACVDNRIVLVDAESGGVEAELRGHMDSVRAVAFDAPGARLASASEDRTLRLWDVARAAPLAILPGLDGVAREVAFRSDGRVVLARSDHEVVLWSAEPEPAGAATFGLPGYGYAAAFAHGGARLVTLSTYPCALRIWDAASGELLLERPGEGKYGDLAAARDVPVFACADGGGIRVFDSDAGVVLSDLGGGPETLGVDSLALSADGTRLASYARTSLRLWDTRSGAQRLVWQGRSEAPYPGVALASDGRRLAIDVGASAILLWDLERDGAPRRLEGHAAPVEALAFSSDGALLASGSRDRSVCLWDTRTGALRWSAPGHTDRVYALAFAPDGTRLASGSNDTTIRLWDVATGEDVAALAGHDDYVFALAFAPDGASLASASGDRSARVWSSEPRRVRHAAGERMRRARDAARPAVAALLAELGDAHAVAERIRADASHDALRREGALQALLQLGARDERIAEER